VLPLLGIINVEHKLQNNQVSDEELTPTMQNNQVSDEELTPTRSPRLKAFQVK
jgi:hypothetical protein